MKIENPEAGTDGQPQYDFAIDVSSDSTHARVVRLVGEGRRVLELGPASGYMSEILSARGCTVVGIELDPEMAAQAAQYCERMIVGDLDTLDLESELGDDDFDVIVAADVLEHLRDPLRLLCRLRHFLRPDGHLVVSLPNVAHASVRLALLEGRFDYRDLGLLDRTHLRFFTRESIARLFDEAELAITELHRQEASTETTEIPVHLDAVPAGIVSALERDPDARTYQFIIKAVTLHAPGMREVQRKLREQALARDEAEVANERELARLRELEEAMTEIASREGQVRTALIDAHDQILRRDEQIDELGEEIEKLERDTGELEQLRAECRALVARCEADAEKLEARAVEVHRLRVRLERILGSPPVKFYGALTRLPLLRAVAKRRTAGYEQAVREARSPAE
jgi:2-polyprenyl-3-methyl-5-hydroxy-6-metoxy-1,4-benzoquinol methylase